MASPFSIFRKHERWMMAILGVMAMIAFVFFDPLFGMRSGRSGPNDPVAAQTSLYGDIHDSDIVRMRVARNLANRFVQQTMALGRGFGYEQPFGPDSEAGVVDTMLLARKAESLGMRVTDSEINRFLEEVSMGRVTAEQYGEILKMLGGGRKGALSRREVYDALRTELLAQHLSNAFAAAQHTTPVQRWESYQRLNSRAATELIPVAVADFVEKIPDPDEATLTTFFETYKNFEAMPGAPFPGFRIPAKVALQYFVADYEQFYDPAAVTAEEVAAEYERNKDTRYLYSGNFNLDDSKPAEGEQPTEGEKPADGEQPDGKPADESAKPTDEAAPASDAKPDQPATPSATESQPDATATEAAVPANPPQQSRRETHDRYGLTGRELALADDPPAEPAASEPAADAAPKSDSATGTTPVADQPNATEAPAATTPSEAQPAAPATDAAISTTAVGENAQPATPKYDPLEKVEPEIRRMLAGQAAVKQMEEALNKVREKMVRYGSAWTNWEARHDRDKTVTQPQPLDFEALAAEHHLTAHSTNLLSARELSEVEGLGESFVGRDSFVAYAFGRWQLFQAVESGDAANNRYLSWKVEERESQIPKLDEVRDDVVRAWKMIEARKPALEHAKALMESANKDKVALTALAERDKLTEIKPAPFSWLTYGATPGFNNRTPPRLSQVEGVEDVGNEFMQTVFNLQTGGIGLAFNNPQTIVYLIQVTDFEPGLELMRRTFLADDYRTYQQVDMPQLQRQHANWANSIKQEAGLKWSRQPDARAAEGESEAGD